MSNLTPEQSALFCDVVRRFRFAALPGERGFRVAAVPRGQFWSLRIVVRVPDRDNWATRLLDTTKGIPSDIEHTEAGYKRFVRDACLEVWAHEMMEGMMYDGERMEEPHP